MELYSLLFRPVYPPSRSKLSLLQPVSQMHCKRNPAMSIAFILSLDFDDVYTSALLIWLSRPSDSYIYFHVLNRIVIEITALPTASLTVDPSTSPKKAGSNLKYLGFLAFLVIPCGCGVFFLRKGKAANWRNIIRTNDSNFWAPIYGSRFEFSHFAVWNKLHSG